MSRLFFSIEPDATAVNVAERTPVGTQVHGAPNTRPTISPPRDRPVFNRAELMRFLSDRPERCLSSAFGTCVALSWLLVVGNV